MNRRAFLIGGATAAVGGSTLLGTGALSGGESQRRVKITVEDDENAYLQLVYGRESVDCQGTVPIVAVANHLREEITDLAIEYHSSSDAVDVGHLVAPDSLGVGEAHTDEVSVECASGAPLRADVTFEISARTENHSVEVETREVEITCRCSEAGSDDDDGEEDNENGEDEQSGDEDSDAGEDESGEDSDGDGDDGQDSNGDDRYGEESDNDDGDGSTDSTDAAGGSDSNDGDGDGESGEERDDT